MHKRIPLLSLPHVSETKTMDTKIQPSLFFWRHFIQHSYLEMCTNIYLWV